MEFFLTVTSGLIFFKICFQINYFSPHLLFNNLTLVSDDDIFNINDIDEIILENFLLQRSEIIYSI